MSKINFSKNLEDYRRNVGMTLSELAQELGYSKSTIHGWLNGVQPKSIHDYKTVATLLGLSIDELCFKQKKTLINSEIFIEINDEKFKVNLKKINNTKEK